jgi:FdhD protein
LTHHWDGNALERRPDALIVEEPLEIHLDGVLVATTMRTPGHDFELAAGLCFTDGLLGDSTVRTCRYCGTTSAVASELNAVSVDTGGAAPPPRPRLTATTSACGMCGTAAIDVLVDRLRPLQPAEPFALAVLSGAPERIIEEQELFAATGAVHAAAAFDRDGAPNVVREDIGRHNAVDKVVGRILLDGALPATDLGLYVSGRASFEIVQKAWAAGFTAIVAVSAPSSLAVEAAHRAGITLCGFTRGNQMNVYCGLAQ